MSGLRKPCDSCAAALALSLILLGACDFQTEAASAQADGDSRTAPADDSAPQNPGSGSDVAEEVPEGAKGETRDSIAAAIRQDAVDQYLASAKRESASPNDQSRHLAKAASHGAKRIVSHLLEAKVDPNARNGEHVSALELAMAHEAPAVIKALVESGASYPKDAPQSLAEAAGALEDRELGNWLLRYARRGPHPVLDVAARGDVDTLAGLLDQEPRAVNATDPLGMTALVRAILSGQRETAELLLARGAHPNLSGTDGVTPLAAAAIAGAAETARSLIDADAIVDYAGPGGRRPLMAALAAARPSTAWVLLDAGANRGRMAEDSGHPADLAEATGLGALAKRTGLARSGPNPRAELVQAITKGDEDRVLMLIKSNSVIDANDTDDAGVPYLHLAAMAAKPAVMRVLLSLGAKLEGTGPSGANVLGVLAANEGTCRACYEAVFDHQMDADFGDRGRARARLSTLINSRDRRGRTAFLSAIIADKPYEAEWMIRHAGGDVSNVADEDGLTPVVAAAIREHDKVVDHYLRWATAESFGEGEFSIYDYARSEANYRLLARLPYDRDIEGMRKGSTKTAIKRFQRRVKEWGYYHSVIDGVIGKGHRSAMFALLDDQHDEVIALAKASEDLSPYEKQWGVSESESGTLYYQSSSDGEMRWVVIEWPGGDSFVGHVQNMTGGHHVMSKGFGVVTRSEERTKELVLLDDTAWDGLQLIAAVPY
ncbi:hypothetical protein H0Z60_14620 [Ectothiorhodospiraceae bacterium WFHF3C12]|nr:hypothetical protein [Ectothiorhodospiraceae bacterium WFHF3C12]